MIKAVALKLQEDSIEQIRKDFDVEDPKWTPEELARIEENRHNLLESEGRNFKLPYYNCSET